MLAVNPQGWSEKVTITSRSKIISIQTLLKGENQVEVNHRKAKTILWIIIELSTSQMVCHSFGVGTFIDRHKRLLLSQVDSTIPPPELTSILATTSICFGRAESTGHCNFINLKYSSILGIAYEKLSLIFSKKKTDLLVGCPGWLLGGSKFWDCGPNCQTSSATIFSALSGNLRFCSSQQDGRKSEFSPNIGWEAMGRWNLRLPSRAIFGNHVEYFSLAMTHRFW